MRKWTTSACVVVALGILALLAVSGCGGPAHAAQAKTSIASSSSSTQVTLASAPAILVAATGAPVAAPALITWLVRPGDTLSGIAAALNVRGGWQALYAANRRVIGTDPGLIRPGTVLAVPGGQRPASYTVAPGDTLSAVAAALGVRGGWQALYAANRRVIGADPGLIRPGMTLAVPGLAGAGKAPVVPGTGPSTGTGGRRAPSSPGTSGGQPYGPPGGGTPAVSGSASPAGVVPAGRAADGVMPPWLKATLLAVGALTVASFVAQPVVAAGRRRWRRRGMRAYAAARQRDRGRRAAQRAARIVQAEHERLIITYSLSDDTVYLLTPPGEDPRAVLRAARLVVPEDTYEDLADHLGVPSGWQRE
ncbi:MAG TPA: LysM domain-containing protein [Trebonia sp.]